MGWEASATGRRNTKWGNSPEIPRATATEGRQPPKIGSHRGSAATKKRSAATERSAATARSAGTEGRPHQKVGSHRDGRQPPCQLYRCVGSGSSSTAWRLWHCALRSAAAEAAPLGRQEPKGRPHRRMAGTERSAPPQVGRHRKVGPTAGASAAVDSGAGSCTGLFPRGRQAPNGRPNRRQSQKWAAATERSAATAAGGSHREVGSHCKVRQPPRWSAATKGCPFVLDAE